MNNVIHINFRGRIEESLEWPYLFMPFVAATIIGAIFACAFIGVWGCCDG